MPRLLPKILFTNDTKVTDMLYDCYALAKAGKDFSGALAAIKARYQEIIDGVGWSGSTRSRKSAPASRSLSATGPITLVSR